MNIIENTRKKCPLVHCITNYVTVNDVANIILACGGSPIMSDCIDEVSDMQEICSALVINIGTLNERTIQSMIAAGKKANELGRVVVLDPVGAGATSLRTETVKMLLKEIKFDVIRGNISEIKAIALGNSNTNGVDASDIDKVSDDNLLDVIEFAKELSKSTKAIIAITGEIDIITDGKKSFITKNGNKQMGKITGTGCMLDGVIASFVAANLDDKLNATVWAVSTMGYCGEEGQNRLENGQGTGHLHINIIDAMSNISDEIIKEGNKIEAR